MALDGIGDTLHASLKDAARHGEVEADKALCIADKDSALPTKRLLPPSSSTPASLAKKPGRSSTPGRHFDRSTVQIRPVELWGITPEQYLHPWIGALLLKVVKVDGPAVFRVNEIGAYIRFIFTVKRISQSSSILLLSRLP